MSSICCNIICERNLDRVRIEPEWWFLASGLRWEVVSSHWKCSQHGMKMRWTASRIKRIVNQLCTLSFNETSSLYLFIFFNFYWGARQTSGMADYWRSNPIFLNVQFFGAKFEIMFNYFVLFWDKDHRDIAKSSISIFIDIISKFYLNKSSNHARTL